MKKLALLFVASALCMGSGNMKNHAGNKVKEAPFYGKEIKAQTAVNLDEVTSNFDKYKGKEVVFDAKVGKVCVKKGCWMTLENKMGNTRVKFKDYKFFVPISLVGQKVRVSGVVDRKLLSVSEAKHYMEDAGVKNPKVDKPVAEYSIMATGVKKL
jgi:hypothetical protein